MSNKNKLKTLKKLKIKQRASPYYHYYHSFLGGLFLISIFIIAIGYLVLFYNSKSHEPWFFYVSKAPKGPWQVANEILVFNGEISYNKLPKSASYYKYTMAPEFKPKAVMNIYSGKECILTTKVDVIKTGKLYTTIPIIFTTDEKFKKPFEINEVLVVYAIQKDLNINFMLDPVEPEPVKKDENQK